MKIITKNPIIVQRNGVNEKISNAFGPFGKNKDKKKDKKGDDGVADADLKRVKTGYFSKGERDERKEERDVSKTKRKKERNEKKEARREKRKAKYGARFLNPFTKGGKQFYKDKLPKLKKKADGNFEKTMPDGSKVDVPKEQVQIIPPPAGAPKSVQPIAVDKKDLNTSQEVVTKVVNDSIEISKNYAENQVEKIMNDGAEVVYKKEDVVDEGSGEDKKPMSKGVKITLWVVGGIAVLGLGYLAYKKFKK